MKYRDCTIRVAKTKALIRGYREAESASLFSHMQKAGFLITRLKSFHATRSVHVTRSVSISDSLTENRLKSSDRSFKKDSSLMFL